MCRELIVRALEERRVLQIIYGGGGPGIVQPHAIVRRADGTEMLEAYQVHGEGDGHADGTHEAHGWKHFDLRRIDHAELLPQYFEPRRDFRPVSSELARVLEQVRSNGTVSPAY